MTLLSEARVARRIIRQIGKLSAQERKWFFYHLRLHFTRHLGGIVFGESNETEALCSYQFGSPEECDFLRGIVVDATKAIGSKRNAKLRKVERNLAIHEMITTEGVKSWLLIREASEGVPPTPGMGDEKVWQVSFSQGPGERL